MSFLASSARSLFLHTRCTVPPEEKQESLIEHGTALFFYTALHLPVGVTVASVLLVKRLTFRQGF